MSDVEQAFADHRKAQIIREAIAYLKAASVSHGDETMLWADEEVMDAAEKYADYLESSAYHGRREVTDE